MQCPGEKDLLIPDIDRCFLQTNKIHCVCVRCVCGVCAVCVGLYVSLRVKLYYILCRFASYYIVQYYNYFMKC